MYHRTRKRANRFVTTVKGFQIRTFDIGSARCFFCKNTRQRQKKRLAKERTDEKSTAHLSTNATARVMPSVKGSSLRGKLIKLAEQGMQEAVLRHQKPMNSHIPHARTPSAHRSTYFSWMHSSKGKHFDLHFVVSTGSGRSAGRFVRIGFWKTHWKLIDIVCAVRVHFWLLFFLWLGGCCAR
jgi:hypothetical protein